MSQKGKNPYADTEFIRAYQESIRAIGEDYDVCVGATITAGAVRGQLMVRLDAYEEGPVTRGRSLCSYTGYWPNANTLSFPSFLFQCAVKLERLVADSTRDLEGLLARPQR